MEVNLVLESLKFMFLGMSVVFLFLILLVFVLKIQAKIVQKYFPEKIVNNDAKQLSQNSNLAVIAAVAASVHTYKQRYKSAKG